MSTDTDEVAAKVAAALREREAAELERQNKLVDALAQATLEFADNQPISLALAKHGLVLVHDIRPTGPDSSQGLQKWLRTTLRHKEGGFLEVCLEMTTLDATRELACDLLLNLRRPAGPQPPPEPTNRKRAN